MTRLSPLFDEQDVRSFEWMLSGTFNYTAGYYLDRPSSTGFTLEMRWSEEEYVVTKFDCDDGSSFKDVEYVPIIAHFATEDGAFNDDFRADAGAVSGGYQLAMAELQGTFTIPESARANYENCSTDPYFVMDDLDIDPDQATATPSVQNSTEAFAAWLHAVCYPGYFPVGIPKFEQVSQ